MRGGGSGATCILPHQGQTPSSSSDSEQTWTRARAPLAPAQLLHPLYPLQRPPLFPLLRYRPRASKTPRGSKTTPSCRVMLTRRVAFGGGACHCCHELEAARACTRAGAARGRIGVGVGVHPRALRMGFKVARMYTKLHKHTHSHIHTRRHRHTHTHLAIDGSAVEVFEDGFEVWDLGLCVCAHR